MDLSRQSNLSVLNMLSRLIIAFLPRSKHLLISCCSHHLQWFWRPKKIKSDTVSTVSPSICHEVVGPDAMIFIFWMLSFKPTFSLSSFTFIKRLFWGPLNLSAYNLKTEENQRKGVTETVELYGSLLFKNPVLSISYLKGKCFSLPDLPWVPKGRL